MQKDNHRILKAEFQPLYLIKDGNTTNWKFTTGFNTDYRPVSGTNNRYWVSENKIDLSGYAMEDLTSYFTDSFEQRGSTTSVAWELPSGGGTESLNSFTSSFIEYVILTSVPFSDDNMLAFNLTAPGFSPVTSAIVNFGNFDRTHIIHGTQRLWSVDSTFSSSFSSDGGAYCIPLQQMNFSSLEPTAADAIYCYRIIMCPNAVESADRGVGLAQIGIPPMRVLLGSVVDEEPTLEYMMRLKRSYELANQV